MTGGIVLRGKGYRWKSRFSSERLFVAVSLRMPGEDGNSLGNPAILVS